eukprot:TRINITY_DN10043_c0_g2_i3.p1 TRINITY_DN10043_c0_g2~~TRINITY_DN10043_c0_g2_i3.p1  ORF type:complete len:145 (-),score=9.66 TRINITY_DN10043_c0_g2_i3:109-543(-)
MLHSGILRFVSPWPSLMLTNLFPAFARQMLLFQATQTCVDPIKGDNGVPGIFVARKIAEDLLPDLLIVANLAKLDSVDNGVGGSSNCLKPRQTSLQVWLSLITSAGCNFLQMLSHNSRGSSCQAAIMTKPARWTRYIQQASSHL